MNRTKLLQKLRREHGFLVAPHVLTYAISVGAVDEPPKNALNRSVYSERHLRQFLTYVAARRAPEKRHRRKKSAKVSIASKA